MQESAQALAGQYNMPMDGLMNHIDDLLNRFTNAALGDTCQRVGGDPARKLSPEDRLIGAGKLALQQGISPCYITVGAAAGVHRYLAENGREQTIENALDVLQQISGLNEAESLTQMILDWYQLLLSGAGVAELRKAAGRSKSEKLGNTI